ncbi:transposase family protein [Streptomyces sp. S6]
MNERARLKELEHHNREMEMENSFLVTRRPRDSGSSLPLRGRQPSCGAKSFVVTNEALDTLTPIPTRRCAAVATAANPDPLYSGKHRDHGIDVQALTTTDGELVFLGRARPGSTHGLSAARADGILDTVTAADVETTADSAYQGADGTVRTPVKRPPGKGHNGWGKQANSALARLRVAAEHPFAMLKRRRAPDRLRISLNRTTAAIVLFDCRPW